HGDARQSKPFSLLYSTSMQRLQLVRRSRHLSPAAVAVQEFALLTGLLALVLSPSNVGAQDLQTDTPRTALVGKPVVAGTRIPVELVLGHLPERLARTARNPALVTNRNEKKLSSAGQFTV